MTNKHLLYWMFENLDSAQIQMLCGLDESFGPGSTLSVGDAFKERYEAYLEAKKKE